MTQTRPSTSRSTAAGSDDVIVAASQLTKVFKDFWLRSRVRAVDTLDFHIDRGEVFGLLGPNGSGKSTTIKIILGLLRKSSGRIQVFGRSPHDVNIKKRIGYLPEESYLYPFLNARETLDYYGKLFKLDHKTRRRRIDELLDMVGLTGVQYRQIHEYSKGMQRRIGLAQALINDPELLILDEPTTGLDPIGARQVKDLIVTLGGRGKTILLSSHLLADVEDCVDRMVILYGGKIRAEGTCNELLVAHSRSVIETESLDDDTLSEIRGVLERHNRRLDKVSAPRQRLEDLFIDIVEQARADRIATAGALNEAGAAAFLRGDDDQGDDLIDRLVAVPEHDAHGPAPVPAAAAPDAERADALIDDLLSSPAHAPGPSAASDGEDASADNGEGDVVNDDIIASLLDQPEPDRPDDPEERRP